MATSEHKPVLIVIAGPNGSGKTSVTSKILHHEWLEDSEYINPDNVDRLYVYDNSIEDAEARLLFRLSDGELVKRYVEDLPNWASAIFSKQKITE